MKQMNEWGPVSMGFREYRQLIKLFMRKHLKQMAWDEEGDDIRDVQAGHSSRTAGLRYGIAADDMAELSSDRLLAMFRASQEWHRLLGFHSKKNMTIAKEQVTENGRKRKQEQEEDQDKLTEWQERIETGISELLKDRAG